MRSAPFLPVWQAYHRALPLTRVLPLPLLQGIAKTGSGKTAAFVLPMVMHVLDQREVQKGEGPVAVVVAPTRELAEQIHREARECVFATVPAVTRRCFTFIREGVFPSQL